MANKKTKKSEEETVKKSTTKQTKKNNSKKETTKDVEERVEVESPIRSGMNETVKGMIIGIVLTALIAFIIILLILGKNDKKNTMMDSFKKYFNRNEPTLIVFASSQCQYCILQKPIVERIGEMYDIDYLYLDYLKLEDSEKDEVVESLGVRGYTPTSVIVQNGKVLKTAEGLMDTKDYVNFLISGNILETGATYKDEENLIEIDYDKFKELLNSKEASAILFDSYAYVGEVGLEERTTISNIAKENNIPTYHLPDSAISETDFINKLGDWGYDTEAYKSEKSVLVPLLMFVKDGKIKWYQTGSMTAEEIRKQFKEQGLIK